MSGLQTAVVSIPYGIDFERWMRQTLGHDVRPVALIPLERRKDGGFEFNKRWLKQVGFEACDLYMELKDNAGVAEVLKRPIDFEYDEKKNFPALFIYSPMVH